MCDCIENVNAQLAPRNTELMLNLLDPTYCVVATEKKDRKKRGTAAVLVASFCPFCGEKYPGRR